MQPKTFYIGFKGLIVKDNKVLVLKNTDQFGKYFWDIPGGRMGEGEEIQQTLIRELTEEILTIKDIHILDFVHVYRLPQNLKDGNGLTLLFYKVEAVIDTVKISDEHAEYRWVGKSDLESLNNDETYISDGYKKAIELALRI